MLLTRRRAVLEADPTPVQTDPAPADARTATLDLSAVPPRELLTELKRCGWQAVPAGAFARITAGLEARLEEATQRAEIAEKEVREVLELSFETMTERRDALVRADRAQADVDVLVSALVRDEFPETIDTNEDDEDR
jgi:hypothetical protein